MLLLSFPGHNNWKVRIHVFLNVFKDSFYGGDKIVCDKSPTFVPLTHFWAYIEHDIGDPLRHLMQEARLTIGLLHFSGKECFGVYI